MVAGADKQCALYEVFQFADVARIGERAEKRHSLRSDFGNRPACLRAVFTHDVVDQQRDIFSAVTQWRKRDGDKVNSIEQVFAESFFAYHCRQIGVCGAHDSDIGVALTAVTEHFICVFLKHPQEFHLTVEVKFTDLVKEDGAAVSYRKTALSVCYSTGECSLLVAEHLAFEK